MYVEDKVSHQGPFPLKVKPSITVKQLKELVERDYEIPIGVQRWILGKQLAGDDSRTLESLGVNTDGCPVFLYLVVPGTYQLQFMFICLLKVFIKHYIHCIIINYYLFAFVKPMQ